MVASNCEPITPTLTLPFSAMIDLLKVDWKGFGLRIAPAAKSDRKFRYCDGVLGIFLWLLL
jgi:hypothetical protein